LLGVNGQLIVVDDLPAAFAAQVMTSFERRSEELFGLAVSGGSTARACYQRLASESSDAIDWLSVNVYWADERCVPADEQVGTANAVYPMSCEEGADAYQLRLGEIGKLDLIHLGLGSDGHTASLFPDSAALQADPGQLVARNEDPSGRNPYPRLTLTFSGIARSRLAVFTVAGVEKRAALQAVVDGDDVPAAHVVSDEIIWLVDRDAAPR
jgi:6-phosphogluconolactonase/glucosamine-6-phosphate isomerase/deaminase